MSNKNTLTILTSDNRVTEIFDADISYISYTGNTKELDGITYKEGYIYRRSNDSIPLKGYIEQ